MAIGEEEGDEDRDGSEVDEDEHARTDVEDLRSAPKEESKDTGNETDREMKPVFMKGLFRCVHFPHPRSI